MTVNKSNFLFLLTLRDDFLPLLLMDLRETVLLPISGRNHANFHQTARAKVRIFEQRFLKKQINVINISFRIVKFSTNQFWFFANVQTRGVSSVSLRNLDFHPLQEYRELPPQLPFLLLLIPQNHYQSLDEVSNLHHLPHHHRQCWPSFSFSS